MTRCAKCGKDVERTELQLTYDCNGIPFRLVCLDCYAEYLEQEYDGQNYNSYCSEEIEEYY